MHRTQILLEDHQYERLKVRSKRTGTAIGELVRRAVDAMYGTAQVEDRLRAIEDSLGTASRADFDGLDGEAYVEQSRHGLERRLRQLDQA